MNDFYAVIPAGGSGSRLWPLSRADSPKFLHDLSGAGKTLIRSTWDRLESFVPSKNILVVTGAAHEEAILREIPEVDRSNLLLEPEPKDSAAAVGLALLHVMDLNPDAIVGSFAADHVIDDDDLFRQAIASAIATASRRKIVTIGVRPTEPSTAFGYIQVALSSQEKENDPQRVLSFVEKPSYEKASEYVGSGRFFWNAGMFVARASLLWTFYEVIRPELASTLRAYHSSSTAGETDAAHALWRSLPKDAIDYVVAEPAAKEGLMEMVVARFGWDDIGDFAALEKLHQPRSSGAVVVLGPNAKVVSQDSSGVVVSQSRRLVSLIGVSDIVVVDTPDALLVTTKEHAQAVKQMVEHMKLEGLEDVL